MGDVEARGDERNFGAWGALGNAWVRLLSIAARFATSPFTNRALGAAGRGVLSVVDNASGTFSILLAPNVPASFYRTLATRRFTPAEYAGTALLIGLAAGLFVPLVFAASYPWLADSAYRNVSPVYFGVAFAACPLLLSRNYLHALMQGLGHLNDANRVLRNEALASLGTTAVLLALGIFRVGTALVVSIGLAAFTLANVVVVLLRDVAFPWRVSRSLLRVSLRDAVGVHLSSVATFLVLRIDVLMLNAYEPASAVGNYVVAVTAAETLLLIPYATQALLFSRSSTSDAEAGGLASVIRATRHTFYWMVLGAGFLALCAPLVIRILGGEQFRAAVTALRLLLPGLVFYGLSMSLAPLWIRSGMYGTQSLLASMCLLLNVGLNLALIPAISIAGAAVASTVAYATGGLCWLWILGRTTNCTWSEVFRLGMDDLRYYGDLWREVRSGG